MKKKVIRSVRFIPFIMFGIDFIELLLFHLEIYPSIYQIMGEISGHSLMTTFYMAVYTYLHRACAYTWAVLISLALLNILNLITEFIELEYYSTYALLCYATVTMLVLITKLKRI
jgi:hypothetical protein